MLKYKRNAAGFSRVELLAVIVVVIVLGAVLFPLLSRKQGPGPRAVACQDHLHQLAIGWGSYAVDNQDQLMPNPGWVSGRMGWAEGQGQSVYFDEQRLMNPKRSLMAGYIKNPVVYKCPAETYKLPGYPRDRVRSVSMNGVLVGSSPSGATVQGTYPGGRKYYGRNDSTDYRPARKLADLNKTGPAQVFVILDEHPDSIKDATFMFDPGYGSEMEWWRDLPGANHQGAGSLVFADGHGELHQWEETAGTNTTIYPVTMKGGTPWQDHARVASRDYEWLNDRMPCW